jgi:hypothetical protein
VSAKIFYAGLGTYMARVELELTVSQCEKIAEMVGPVQAAELRQAAEYLDNQEDDR